MKTSTIALHAPARSGKTESALVPKQDLARTLRLAFVILVSAIPTFTLVILTTWVSNVPALMPYFQATAWLTGIVFLALALESDRKAAVALILSAVAMFVSAPLAASVSPDFLVVDALVIAAWTGHGVFGYIRRIAGC